MTKDPLTDLSNRVQAYQDRLMNRTPWDGRYIPPSDEDGFAIDKLPELRNIDDETEKDNGKI